VLSSGSAAQAHAIRAMAIETVNGALSISRFQSQQ
jgi:hypothetical protein